MITGLVVAGIALASVIYSPLMTYLFGTLGLKYGFILFGGAVLIISVTLAQFLTNPPKGYMPAGTTEISKDPKTQGSGAELNWKKMIRTADRRKHL